MKPEFNPLESKLLFAKPIRLHAESAWNEHVPFAMLLVELLRPRVVVELGTHRGVSFCAFCQAVSDIRSETRCYAVDTWAGDDHAGHYSNEIYEDLKEYHKKYESFSRLLRMTFDEALQHIPDYSVDLLHIDGLHTYEAVKRDYETWLPKMSENGVILFHDTVVVERGFGVHQLWGELISKYPYFNFKHGYGLGVLLIGKNPSQEITNFIETANKAGSGVQELFEALGRRVQLEAQFKEMNEELNRLSYVERSSDYRLGRKIIAPLRKLKKVFGGKASPSHL
jgi:O-antigen biosynthesis protein